MAEQPGRLAQSLDELHLFAASLEEGKDALHAMNAELRLTSAALAQLNDKVLITRAVDATGGQYQPQPIIFANDAFLLRTGYTREELLGQSLTADSKVGAKIFLPSLPVFSVIPGKGWGDGKSVASGTDLAPPTSAQLNRPVRGRSIVGISALERP